MSHKLNGGKAVQFFVCIYVGEGMCTDIMFHLEGPGLPAGLRLGRTAGKLQAG